MKVSELIDFLETQEPDALVVISANDGGVNDCQTAIGVKVLMNANADRWFPGLGMHEITFKNTRELNKTEKLGVLIQ